MDYEEKDKKYLIGSIILLIIIVLLYATYFIFGKAPSNSTRNTSEALIVNNSNKVEISNKAEVINSEEIAEEIIDGVEESLDVLQKDTKKKNNNQYKKVEIIDKAVEDMQDVIIDTTIYYTKK